jgi:hypothetical protein
MCNNLDLKLFYLNIIIGLGIAALLISIICNFYLVKQLDRIISLSNIQQRVLTRKYIRGDRRSSDDSDYVNKYQSPSSRIRNRYSKFYDAQNSQQRYYRVH